MPRFRTLTLIFCLLFLVGQQLLGQQGAKTESSYRSNNSVQIQPVLIKGLGVQLRQAKLESDFGANSSRLRFHARNNSGGSIGELRFAAYFLRGNSVLGGQEWCTKGGLNPGAERAFQYPVPYAFSEPTTILLLIRHATNRGQAFDISGADIRQAAETLGTGPVSLMPQLSVAQSVSEATTPNVLCDPTFCTECKNNALQVCGSKGVHSYSCSISTCTCSFQCN